MIYKDKNNKVYSALKVDDDTIQQMIDDCIELKSQTSPLKTDELSVRRNEKMRRKVKNVDTFKKVAVASLSLAATGAIIVGAMAYKNQGSNGVAKGVQKPVVETTTEIVEQAKDENKIEVLNANEPGIKVDKNEDINYKTLCPEDGSQVFESKEDGKEVYKYGGYIFTMYTAENSDSENEPNVTVKKQGEDTEHEIIGMDSAILAAPYTYSNGKYIYYCYKNRLYKYNLETNESESMILFDEKDTNAIVDCIHDGKLLIDIATSKEVVEDYYYDFDNTVVSYDIKSGKTQVAEGRDISEYIDDGYFITFKTTKYEGMKDAFGRAVSVVESCVEKINETGFEEVAKLGNHSRFKGASKSGDKLYFAVYGELEEGKADDESQFIFKEFDKKTCEVKTLGEIKSEDLGYDNGTIVIDKVTDEYLVGLISDENCKETKFKFTYATKKIEKITKKN